MEIVVEEDAKIIGGFFLGLKSNGSCVIKGMGEINCEDAEQIAKNLILIAARIRTAARESPGMQMLH